MRRGDQKVGVRRGKVKSQVREGNRCCRYQKIPSGLNYTEEELCGSSMVEG